MDLIGVTAGGICRTRASGRSLDHGVQAKGDVVPEPSLNDATVRQFGDTAILTGILTDKTARETNKSGTTVVFVRRGGTWLIASVQWSRVEGGR
jgi:hypothetical protein